VKKKNPPYAYLGAIVLFILGLVILVHWEKGKQVEADARVEAQKEADAKALAEAQEKSVTVPSTPTNMRKVLYATQPVEPGIRISPAFYEQKLTPTDILPDAYSDQNQADITGWVAIRHIEKGDPLTPRNIGKTMPSMAQRISPGMRAVSLPIFNAEVNDTGGFVVDGDKVDLLYSVSTAEGDYKVNTQTILQNINVLYVPGPQSRSDKTDGVVPAPPPGDTIAVTFEVTPEEAQELIFLGAAKNGRFSMILRSGKDTSELKIKPFNAVDYDLTNLSKVQRTADKSIERVKALAAAIAEKEKQAQGNTNETNTPPSAP
jgi:Flp pilus assembly protein CpaB